MERPIRNFPYSPTSSGALGQGWKTGGIALYLRGDFHSRRR